MDDDLIPADDGRGNVDAYFRGRFNTELTPEETFSYHNWLDEESKKTGKDRSNDAIDYDLQGFYKDGQTFSEENGHGSDRYKKPNHPTFSDQSRYHGIKDANGTWEGGAWGEDANGTTFTPSKRMLETTHPANWLRSYMRDVEPGTTLLLKE
jgi:hypothetical protein